MPILPWSVGRPGSGRRVPSRVCPETRPNSLGRLCVEGRCLALQSVPQRRPSFPLDSAPLTQLSDAAPSGSQWIHEIKLDGFRMAARIEGGRAQLLTRTGLDWSDKYPSMVAALAKVRAKTARPQASSSPMAISRASD